MSTSTAVPAVKATPPRTAEEQDLDDVWACLTLNDKLFVLQDALERSK